MEVFCKVIRKTPTKFELHTISFKHTEFFQFCNALLKPNIKYKKNIYIHN